MLQTGLVHLFATYPLTLHVRVSISQNFKVAELPPQSRLEMRKQKVYKRKAGQSQRINRFLSLFLSLYLSSNCFFRLSP